MWCGGLAGVQDHTEGQLRAPTGSNALLWTRGPNEQQQWQNDDREDKAIELELADVLDKIILSGQQQYAAIVTFAEREFRYPEEEAFPRFIQMCVLRNCMFRTPATVARCVMIAVLPKTRTL